MSENHLTRGERMAIAFWRTQPVSGTDFRIAGVVEREEREAKRLAIPDVSFEGIACPSVVAHDNQMSPQSPLHIELRKRGIRGIGELARKCGYAYATLAVARRTRRPSDALLAAVAKALDVDAAAARVVLLLPSSLGRPNETPR